MNSKYADLGNLAECWRCQDSVQTYSSSDGQTIVLDVRPTPTYLVPAELRWRVNGNGIALPLGWAEPTDTVRITHDPVCVESPRTDLGRLRAHLDDEHIVAQGLATVIAALTTLVPHQDLYPTADDVRTVRCPVCGAAPDTSCTNFGGQQRPSNHRDRVTELREARYDASPVARVAGRTARLLPPPRTRVRTVACPRCLALPGQPCWTKSQSGTRTAHHKERVNACANAA
ncbi:DUF6083 domain-containing protein (plasmid) [Streptomyces microflavus]|uniref:zinc finger domain-containing protein n=1 Tax=Streptomyces microflavus TaxID=1919 RepID=UPI002E0D5B9B|nr:DUF6083 domain-containing protein [Streptomyces microflavus]